MSDETETIYVCVIRGESGRVPIADVSCADEILTPEVIAWAERNGCVDTDPDVWLGVQDSGNACPIPNELASREVEVPVKVADAIRAQIAADEEDLRDLRLLNPAQPPDQSGGWVTPS